MKIENFQAITEVAADAARYRWILANAKVSSSSLQTDTTQYLFSLPCNANMSDSIDSAVRTGKPR